MLVVGNEGPKIYYLQFQAPTIMLLGIDTFNLAGHFKQKMSPGSQKPSVVPKYEYIGDPCMMEFWGEAKAKGTDLS